MIVIPMDLNDCQSKRAQININVEGFEWMPSYKGLNIGQLKNAWMNITIKGSKWISPYKETFINYGMG